MNKQEQVQQMTTYMANFVSHIAKVLPDDIIKKLDELGAQEDAPLSKVIYETMKRSQKLAKELNRPSCQDTGVLQFWVKCGVDFPLIGEVEGLLKEAVVKSTFEAPLRHNSVETFDEFNTGLNVGKGTPTVWWDIIPNSDKCEIYAYMAGGGCTLPGKAMVLMPGAGYEGVTKFVMDVMTSYGINACPPLLVGVGVATSVETAALLSCWRTASTPSALALRAWAASTPSWACTSRTLPAILLPLALPSMWAAGAIAAATSFLIKT